MKPLPDPSLPLTNSKRERYCIERAAGRTLAESYATANGKELNDKTNLTLRVSGKRWADMPAIAARIEHIRRAARARDAKIAAEMAEDLPSDFSKETILALFLEVSQTLRDAYVVAQNSAVSPTKIEQLRKCWRDHTARLARYEEETGAELPNEMDGGIAALNARLRRIAQ